MADHFLPGPPAVPLTLRRSARARRISLRISQLDGRVTLTLPRGVPEDEALSFARIKEDWIRGHLQARPADVAVAPGALLPVEGVARRVVAGTGRGVRLTADEVAVPERQAARRLHSWLRELARDRLAGAADEYARALGRDYARITLRDTRSRWGSCSSRGALMFSWRLVMAPPEVLRYVAAHEIAHLEQMNHSAAFWAAVERVHGPYDAPRSWLHTHGAALHRFRFPA
ncbi:M48 family metallopeptidase [Antarcticimicrobium luteum]|uniref:M48 family peptidase n=1 Tax=Antarcticimicrobium luteum TaxID=2547397 RepID=A0A4R5UTN5_9RHOB|nr:SprT family zinc-dependent metalloprotease [Antarcticimicrobium luteum]TDK42395.1 M48 family peptidase [Antarcticimicrobium luteum]